MLHRIGIFPDQAALYEDDPLKYSTQSDRQEVCPINPAGLLLVKKAMEKLQLSERAYDRILKMARTAADLGGSEGIRIKDLAEAIHFRSLDRESWVG